MQILKRSKKGDVNINSGLKSPVKQKNQKVIIKKNSVAIERVHDTYLRSGASRSIRGPRFKSKQEVIPRFAGDGVHGGTRVVARQISSLSDPNYFSKYFWVIFSGTINCSTLISLG